MKRSLIATEPRLYRARQNLASEAAGAWRLMRVPLAAQAYLRFEMTGTEQAEAESAVLLVNASFYRAFSEGDVAGMLALWAKRVPVTCLHPGAELLAGKAVAESWRQILGGAGGFELRCDSPSVRLFGEVAIVQCYEGTDAQPAHLAATNAFVLEDGAWRMVHHHAGPLSRPIAPPRSLMN